MPNSTKKAVTYNLACVPLAFPGYFYSSIPCAVSRFYRTAVGLPRNIERWNVNISRRRHGGRQTVTCATFLQGKNSPSVIGKEANHRQQPRHLQGTFRAALEN